MTRFTDSPYEYLMTQKPYAGRERDSGPVPYPPQSRCAGCPYGSGKPCIGVCMKKLLSQSKKSREGDEKTWEKTHKQALLTAVLIAAALAGLVFALSPAWERHRAEEKQEAMLSRLESSMPQKENSLQKKETEPFQNASRTVKITADTAVPVDAVKKTEKTPESEAEPETVKKPEKDMPQAGAEIGILSIPKIDARLPVTAGVSEEQLKISEGWVMQTEMIGSVGNAVIAGHRSYTYGKHFNRLGELETGDEIFYTAADGTEMCFIVNEILTVLPDDPAVFAAPLSGGSQLTLYTCTPVKVATHRLLVRALRVEE